MLPNYKDIMDLVKKGATVEAQEKIMELREAALEFQEENIRLRERVKKIEGELKIKGNVEYIKSSYWLNNEGAAKQGPYCQRCYDVDQILVRLQDWDDQWMCKGCDKTFDK